jgi:hypothetical protein
MRTREGARDGAPVSVEQMAPATGGMRRAALTALTALAGGGLLIVVGALMSICWTIHPLLTPVAAVGVVWLAGRGMGLVLRGPDRS